MTRSRSSKTTLAMVSALMLVLTLGGIAGAAPNPDADPHYPDLPKHETGGAFYGALSDTLVFASASQQYARIDDARVAADVKAGFVRPEPGQETSIDYAVRAYAIDGDHDVPQTFGLFPDTRVRTVAFGAVPAEATIHVSQLRDDGGLLVPLDVSGQKITWLADAGPRPGEFSGYYNVVGNATMAGQVDVRISDVTVDGVAVDVGAACRSVAPAQLSAVGKGYVDKDYSLPVGEPIPPGKFNPAIGGLLTGSISIPAFTGCSAGGDDLGPLLTAMVSGETLPVKIFVELLNGACFNDHPGTYTLAKCAVPDLPFPGRAK